MSGEEAVSLTPKDEAIVRTIIKMAEDRAEAIKREAKRRAEEILSRARTEAEEILRSRRERAERELREEIARKRSSAEVEANKLLLSVKSEMLSELLRRVEASLAKIADREDPKWDYKEILKRYIKQGAEVLGERKVRIIVREKDKKLAEEVAKELSKEGLEVVVDERTLPLTGGVVVADERDERRFYNTFDGRLRAYREAKEVEILRELFEGV